jgi:hypothetical protein
MKNLRVFLHFFSALVHDPSSKHLSQTSVKPALKMSDARISPHKAAM